ncbi:MAG: hypothetical protein N2Z20_00890 [Elusimicrobiales bacterium]|nr:hypothetical protein [Elusimicrobiales bacterium]
MSVLIIILSLMLNAHEVDISLEKTSTKLTSKPIYTKIEYINLSERNNNFRVRVNFKNTSSKKLKAIVMRYSFKIILERNSNRFETISLVSSFLRESEIKPYESKSFYIYGIKNLFMEINKLRKVGYKPMFVKIELMKEPKKDEDIIIKDALFEIKEDF